MKYLDENGLLYVIQKIKGWLGNKVDKETGKGLSTNDFTTEEKNKLQGLENYTLPAATADKLGGVKVGAGLAINNGVLSATGGGTADAVDWENVQNKPTKLSEFTNDKGYQTATEVESAITSKGYQTASQVEKTITDKGYQTAAQVNTAITGKGYQTASQVETIVTGKGYQTADDVDALIEEKDYLSSTEVETAITSKGYQTATQVNSAITSKGYQTSAQVESAITSKGYQTQAQVNSAISSAIAGVTQFNYEKVSALPTTGVKGTIYLVPSKTTGSGNVYDEYIWVEADSKFEFIGTTAVDLSGYVQETDLSAITNTEIDNIISAA